ncbi:hypothetical protein ANANG_G00025810 [Anguilla anguilla]|uniref:Uncharacterized protein n=1 Tax=Anguilla anguilla TaxID=7936 RepID=A0A9D3N175_ANGAN|nr:hypothetical protein ANANG_G00025810 [Anguilla anguilla]
MLIFFLSLWDSETFSSFGSICISLSCHTRGTNPVNFKGTLTLRTEQNRTATGTEPKFVPAFRFWHTARNPAVRTRCFKANGGGPSPPVSH